MLAASLRQVLGDCLRGAGFPLRGTVAEVVGWIVAIVALVILVPRLATIGAATAVGVSYAAALLVSAFFAMRLGVRVRDLFVPGRNDLATAIEVLREILAAIGIRRKARFL